MAAAMLGRQIVWRGAARSLANSAQRGRVAYYSNGPEPQTVLGHTAYNPDWVNKVMLTGNLGRGIELTETGAGCIGRTTLAVRRGKDKDPDWYQIELYDVLAKEAAQQLMKGSKVHVQGSLRQDPYEDSGIKRLKLVVAADVLFTIDPNAEPQQYEPPVQQQQQQQQQPQQQQQKPATASPSPPPSPRQAAPVTGASSEEEKWIDLFANPNDYWDNRFNKLNPKAPDFKGKNKEKDVALWLSSRGVPTWVQARLQELPPPPPPRQ